MIVWGVTEAQVQEAATEVGLRLPHLRRTGVTDRSALTFRLRLDSAQRLPGGGCPYQRVSLNRSHSGNGGPRRVAAVCWHGHRDFMRALFRKNANMRLKSSLADYRGFKDFHDKYRSTQDGWGHGYAQACTCAERRAA